MQNFASGYIEVVRAIDAALQAEADGLRGQRLDMAREGIVGFVAMHVDRQAAIGGDAAERFDRFAVPSSNRPLEMRNAPDDVDAHVERAVERIDRARRAIVAVLGEGDQLQIDIGRDLLADLEQRLDGQQPGITGVDMAANEQQALGDSKVAIAQGTIDQSPPSSQSGASSPQSAMPSSRVPETFMRGRPSDSVASM
jgi:hypothetical protein